MTFHNILIMRHELLLTIVMLLVLIIDLFATGNNRKLIIPIALILFLTVTAIGFLPAQYGQLFGGMYITSGTTILMKNVLNIAVFIILLQSVAWLKLEENKQKLAEYFVLILSTLIGMNFMISSGDFLMLYIGLETATIPLAALAAYTHHQTKSAEAGIKLILSSALSSGIMLYGISMVYGTTGSVSFAEVALQWGNAPLQMLAFLFFFAGMAFKISLVPFHLWTADVYEGAPVNVTSYLSVVSKGSAAFVLMLVLFRVFPSIVEHWQKVLYAIAVLTMTVGNLFALRQQNLKRFLAFSSIAQAGFILLGIIGASPLGMSTVIFFVLAYVFTNLAAFGVISAVSSATGKENMADYNGLYQTNPKLSLLLMLALFSLAGIPPVAGFFGKFFLFASAASKGFYWLVFIAVVNATVSLYYYLLPVKAMFINKNEQPVPTFRSDFYMKAGLLLAAAGTLAVGMLSIGYEYIASFSYGLQ
ncbi:MAG TPA: NADH-quinone oxidoreductase subunit N [Bacteroidales bacterium]|nr:MAG: NADH-quinone oxidoreductase subunit N [Bacteroidetes bacterium GWE2_42_24]OFY31576.1 MAG: NADH-quinone oxidoreductase subunit N [Bacteroidetes bacterium GWF2_43_11]HAQ65709.1 NADH-quinone oxidoreductase subunit N [Bacteroidales bacterium]HBZ67173.1 NADH-quinone oxidoreductase subunit N [Bacteroidales bacterium]